MHHSQSWQQTACTQRAPTACDCLVKGLESADASQVTILSTRVAIEDGVLRNVCVAVGSCWGRGTRLSNPRLHALACMQCRRYRAHQQEIKWVMPPYFCKRLQIPRLSLALFGGPLGLPNNPSTFASHHGLCSFRTPQLRGSSKSTGALLPILSLGFHGLLDGDPRLEF